jgi:hypothetical protein
MQQSMLLAYGKWVRYPVLSTVCVCKPEGLFYDKNYQKTVNMIRRGLETTTHFKNTHATCLLGDTQCYHFPSAMSRSLFSRHKRVQAAELIILRYTAVSPGTNNLYCTCRKRLFLIRYVNSHMSVPHTHPS